MSRLQRAPSSSKRKPRARSVTLSLRGYHGEGALRLLQLSCELFAGRRPAGSQSSFWRAGAAAGALAGPRRGGQRAALWAPGAS